MVFAVTYEFGKRRPEHKRFFKELEASQGWWHFIESTWLIETNETPEELNDRLSRFLYEDDFLLIIQAIPPYQGWLPKEAWNWIQERLG